MKCCILVHLWLLFVDGGLLVVPRTRMVTEGDPAFAVQAPKHWNDLPVSALFLYVNFISLYFIISFSLFFEMHFVT